MSKVVTWLLRKHKLNERQLYDSVAERYAASDGRAAPILKSLVNELVAEKRPSSVLDLGCGAGRYFPVLKGDLIVGVDLSVGMLKQALRKFKHANLIQGDIFHLPFKKGIFDVAISMSIMGELCPFSEALLGEVRRTLSKKSSFAFTVVPLYHYVAKFPIVVYCALKERRVHSIFCASRHRIKANLKKLGFRTVRIEEVHEIHANTPHYYVVGTRHGADA
jgi:ubiquinone/menaquinone biosynthesis C-methylase UbiE